MNKMKVNRDILKVSGCIFCLLEGGWWGFVCVGFFYIILIREIWVKLGL